MQNISNIKKVYFLGIGGIGMSALARYFKAMGADVSGYDKTPTPLTDELIHEGIAIHFDENVSLLPMDADLYVYTPAIPKDHKEYVSLLQNGYTIHKRAEILGLITKDKFTIAIAGTHGKTTITSMIAHILKQAGKDVFSFIGGISKNYNSNLILSGNNTIAVVEADEFDRSFLRLYSDIAVISSMDADHLDVYGNENYMVDSFSMFAAQCKKDGKLFLKKNLKLNEAPANTITYSANEKADFFATDIKIEDLPTGQAGGHFNFCINCPDGAKFNVKAGIPGMHNVENAVVSCAVAYSLGVQSDIIANALHTYSGVQRRFDFRIKTNDLVYIDDYAHHPEEIRACLNAIKELYPGKKITGIFQPHLFTRTRDLADGFVETLSLLDDLILLDIYPARELPIEGVTSKMLLDKINIKNKTLCSKEKLIQLILQKKIEVLVTMGAGDIDKLVEFIEKCLKK